MMDPDDRDIAIGLDPVSDYILDSRERSFAHIRTEHLATEQWVTLNHLAAPKYLVLDLRCAVFIQARIECVYASKIGIGSYRPGNGHYSAAWVWPRRRRSSASLTT